MPEKKINILLIHADQHRWDCLGAYGNTDVKTSSIDSLALDGVLHHNCFCTFPVCTPSRYSLLTGLYVHQHLGWNNHCTIPHGLATFPRILKDAGYRTSCVGKMHFTPTYLEVGFERMQLAEQDGPGRFDDDYHRYLRNKGLVDSVDTMDQVCEIRKNARQEYFDDFGSEKSNLPEENYSTTWIGDRAVEELKKWTCAGNLLMVGFIKPHHPHDAPEPWSGMYDAGRLSILPGWTGSVAEDEIALNRGYFDNEKLTEEKLRKVMAQYYASITQIDHHVGRLIGVLKDKGLYDNTLIIYTSDHGEYLGFHHMMLKANYMYDPLIKIPLVVKYPKQLNSGKRNANLYSAVDITATILDQAGLKAPDSMMGMPLDKGGGRDLVFAESDHVCYMVRTRKHKLILMKGDVNPSKLFDLDKDPLEMANLIGDPAYSDILSDLKGKLFQWLASGAVSPVHLDEDAPLASGRNVLHGEDGRREDMKKYLFTR